MTQEQLQALDDDELRRVITASTDLLAARDRERKEKALREAGALLASVGLSLKPDAVRQGVSKTKRRSPTYHTGRIYQHPDDPGLRWNGTGVRPAWVKSLEQSGKKPVEVASPDGGRQPRPSSTRTEEP